MGYHNSHTLHILKHYILYQMGSGVQAMMQNCQGHSGCVFTARVLSALAENLNMDKFSSTKLLQFQASSNWVPGSLGLPVEQGGATTRVAARARRATTSSSNASVITTLCAVHPFI